MLFWTEAGQRHCDRTTWSTTELHLIAAVKQFRHQRDANERNSQNILINIDAEELYDDPMDLRTAAAFLFMVMRWFHVLKDSSTAQVWISPSAGSGCASRGQHPRLPPPEQTATLI